MNKVISVVIMFCAVVASMVMAGDIEPRMFEGHSIGYCANGVRVSGYGYFTMDEWNTLRNIFHNQSDNDLSIYDVVDGKAFLGVNTNGEFCISEYKTYTWDEWKKLLDDYTESEKDGEKEKSDLYQCAENDFVYPSDAIETYEDRQQVAQDLTNARMSDIRQVTKKIGGEMRVYFEICGSGYSLAERHAIEKEIQDAIKQILDKHFDK